METIQLNPEMFAQVHNVNKEQQTQEPTTNSSILTNSGMSNILQYILIGLSIVTIVALIIFLIYKKLNSKVYDLGEQLEVSRKENALLKNKLKQHEIDKASYVHRIDELANELEHINKVQEPYSATLPMRTDSYDAPDPDKQQQKPQIVKDKEAIKAMVNRPRPTVQDEIDHIEQEKLKQQEETDELSKNEITNTTHQEQSQDINNNDDENEVENIMNIIQSQ